jgi:glycosyltransferase involved in cell wall biosynthesis
LTKKTKICHLSSVHYAIDTRIFYKMCKTLSKEYEVTLIANHPQRDIIDGISIIPSKVFKNRKYRVFFSWIWMFFKAIKVNAKLYHFHDPELIPCGILLKMLGKKVIYDIHENIAEDIFDKPWIKHPKIAYRVFNAFEKLAVKQFYIILAENSYQNRYIKMNANYQVVLNYCDVDFFKNHKSNQSKDIINLFYIGILLENRGILQIIQAIQLLKQKGLPIKFHIVGELYSDLRNKILNLENYEYIKEDLIFYNKKPLDQGYEIASKMNIGMCIIWPMKNSIESYPTKLFEYMAVGLPIITSNFPLYKKVVEENDCGICVNPISVIEISEAIESISKNVSKSEQMAKNGKKTVLEQYNWETQKPILTAVYKQLLKKEK